MLFSSLFSGLLATSLLGGEALAGRFDARKRALVVEDVIVTQAITVLAHPDGTFVTLEPVNIGTSTVAGTPVVEPTIVAPAATVAPVRAVVLPDTAPVVDTPAVDSPALPASSSVDVVPTTFSTVTSRSPSPTTPTGAKRGLAYNNPAFLSAFVGTGSQATWCYNWGAGPDGTVPGSLEYVPMLWGNSHGSTGGWDDAVTKALAAGSTHLLAFNEPDLAEQANIGVQDAANGYMQWMQKYAGRARLGAPAVTNGPASAGMGVGYLTSFMQACESLGCTIDFVPIHWYSDVPNAQNFKDHVTDSYAAGGNRPIWITEFALNSVVSADQQAVFLAEVLPWLDAQPFVERYAYFMVAEGSLVSGTGLSPLGKSFAFSP